MTEYKLEDKTAFQEMATIPAEVFSGHLSTFKKREALYVISGYIEPNEDGQIVRNNDNLIRRDLFFIDYDDIDLEEDEFKQIVHDKLKDYNYMLYPSVSNGLPGKGVRYRLILEPDRPLVEYEYKYVLKKIVDYIGVEVDSSSLNTWSQMQGLPAHRNKVTDYQIHINEGKAWETPKRGEVPLPVKKTYQYNADKVKGGAIPHDEAIEMLRAYVEVDAQNLTSYENSISAIMVMAKAVMKAEIAEETALEGCKIIAMGNVDWAEGNTSTLLRVLDRGIEPRTPYSFRVKFHDLFFKKVDTMEILKERLTEAGEAWREVHTEKGNIPPVPPRTVADIMLKFCSCVLIDEDDPELSPLAIYDPDEGIYKKGERFINNLALTVERTLTEQSCKHVKHFVTNDDKCKEVERTLDPNLIVCNNGVYDRKQKKLLPFSNEWVFINKITTDYIPNAKEPTFEKWQFTKWIKELSNNDPKKELLFYQMFYSAINANYISEVAFFFYSIEGRTGKGTLQEFLRELVGNKNTANLKIKEFEADFKISTIYGKSLVLGDDNNPKDFNDTSENFKSVITGDGVLLNAKYEKPFNTKLTPLVVQSMNGIPKFADTTDGLTRRLRIIEFKTAYKGECNDRRVKDEFVRDKRLHQYVLAKVIDMQFDDIVSTQESEELIENIVLDNDPVTAFYEDVITELVSERVPTKFLFAYFKSWCLSENSPTKMKQRNFTKQMRDILEAKGWEYSKKNLQPLEYWKKEDVQKYETVDAETGNFTPSINYEVEKYRQQGLFYKD